MKYDVFISYRRRGGSERAELLKAIFEKNGYLPERIFMDTHTLKGGDFQKRLKESIREAQNFIILITKDCFTNIKDGDYFVYEISEALRLNKNIVPVFFDDINTIEQKDVPEVIRNLQYHNAVSYNHEYADASYNKLCSFLVNDREDSYDRKKMLPQGKKPLRWILPVIVAALTIGVFVVNMLTKRNVPAQAEEQKSEAETINQVRASTMLMIIGNSPYATAFLVSDGGLALTANHVLNSNTISDSTYVFCNDEMFNVKNIVCENAQLDFTLFQIEPKGATFKSLTIATDPPAVGSVVWVSSYDFYNKLTPTMSKGEVEAVSIEDSRIRTSAKIYDGFSGAPVLNAKGEVVGIALSCYEKNDTPISSYALNLHVIRPIVEATIMQEQN